MNLRDIKTKQKIQAIKIKDTKGNIQHFIKQQTIHNKNVDRKEEASVKSNPQVQATNKVSFTTKQTVIESKHRATKFRVCTFRGGILTISFFYALFH